MNENSLCKKCKKDLEQQMIWTTDKYENDITKYFDEHFYIFKYEGIIRNKIINYKFNDNPHLYKLFSHILLNNEKTFDFLKRYDIIIPVPISYKRYKERGYNQSKIIAKEISKNTQLKLNTNCLYKNKNIVAQSTLNKEERIQNVQNVYDIRKNNLSKIIDKNIVILDDVYTTGSTVNECAKILKTAGIKNIGVITIAKD